MKQKIFIHGIELYVDVYPEDSPIDAANKVVEAINNNKDMPVFAELNEKYEIVFKQDNDPPGACSQCAASVRLSELPCKQCGSRVMLET